jgi:hypothetical protein
MFRGYQHPRHFAVAVKHCLVDERLSFQGKRYSLGLKLLAWQSIINARVVVMV